MSKRGLYRRIVSIASGSLSIVALVAVLGISALPSDAAASELPVAAYSFDAGEGATAEDLAGEHDGTIEGATWAKGRYGSALKFDGVNDCVSIPHAADLALSEEFTLEAWVKPEGSMNSDPVIFKEDNADFSYSLGIGLTETGRVEAYEDDEEGAVSPSSLTANVWTHVAATYDGARVRVFVDGTQVASNLTGPETMTSSGALEIGCASNYEEHNKGRIDEVRLYDRALDAGEIAADRAAPIATPQAGPVAAYSFDAGEGATAEDLAGEHDGTIEGATWAKGRYGSALLFDEEDCVTVADGPELHLTEDFTLEAWVKPDDDQIQSDPIFFKETEDFYSYFLGLSFQSNGKIEGYIGEEDEENYTLVSSPEALTPNVWAHIALTYDGNFMRLYLNGALVDSNITTVGNVASSGPLRIGCSEEFEEYLDGKIDEPRIYDRALDAGEIAADRAAPIATPQAGPVAAYSFDAGEGATAEDLAGEHDGTIEGATWAKGRYGSALKFDGVNDCVSIPHAADLALSEEFTLEAWVRPEGSMNSDPVIFKEDNADFSYSLGIGLTETGKVEAYEDDEEGSISPSSITANVWTHVAATYDGARVRVFVDGAQVASNLTGPETMTSSGALEIGCASNYEEHNKGRIDDIRIYDRALDESELQQTMNAGFPVAITEAATEVGANAVILNGAADASGAAAEYFFEYGLTESYGSVITGEELGSNRETLEINEAAIDLVPETAYHYRLAAVSAVGTAYGEDRTFTTAERTLTIGEEEELANAENNFDLTASEKKAGPGDFYGMMWSGDLEKMQKDNIYEAVKNSGAKMLRLAIQPGNQTKIDHAFTATANRGITVLPYIGHGPFPKPGTQNEKDWIEYAEKMVKKYGPDSSFSHPVKTWEIWNEPNMPFQASSDEQQGKVNPKMFAEFFKKMSEAIRSTSEGEVEILAPGLYGYRVGGCHPECHLTPRAFLKRMDEKLSELGYSNAYNAISLHPYIFKIGDRRPLHGPKDEADVERVSKAVERSINAVHSLKPGKPLWITELGFPVENRKDPKKKPPVTNVIQKQLVRATFTMMQNNRKSLNIARAFYYNIQDKNDPAWDYHSGLLTLKGKARPAWMSYSGLAGGEPCPHAPC